MSQMTQPSTTDAGPAADDSTDASSASGNTADATAAASAVQDAGSAGDAGSASASSSTDADPADASSTTGSTTPSDAGASSGTATPTNGSTATAPVDHTTMVAIPSGINAGLTAVDNAAMLAAFGPPGSKTTDCSAITNQALQNLTATANVGPFSVTGLRPALDALTRIFSAVNAANPTLYAVLGTAGMSCVRLVRGSTTNFSNHAWGTAIDLTIAGFLTPRGSTTVSNGLVELCPFFAAEQFFWGAGFSTPDGMHFEVSAELLAQWKANGTIP